MKKVILLLLGLTIGMPAFLVCEEYPSIKAIRSTSSPEEVCNMISETITLIQKALEEWNNAQAFLGFPVLFKEIKHLLCFPDEDTRVKPMDLPIYITPSSQNGMPPEYGKQIKFFRALIYTLERVDNALKDPENPTSRYMQFSKIYKRLGTETVFDNEVEGIQAAFRFAAVTIFFGDNPKAISIMMMAINKYIQSILTERLRNVPQLQNIEPYYLGVAKRLVDLNTSYMKCMEGNIQRVFEFNGTEEIIGKLIPINNYDSSLVYQF